MQRIIRYETLRKLRGPHRARRYETLTLAITDEVIAPSDQLARLIEPGFQILKASGTIVIVRHIVFAGPEELNRYTHFFRDVRCLDHVVVGQTPTEPAAPS